MNDFKSFKLSAIKFKCFHFLFLVRLCTGYFLQTQASPSQRSFQGCMQLIQVDDQLVDLVTVEHGMLGAFENVSLDMCTIIDRSEHQMNLHLPCYTLKCMFWLYQSMKKNTVENAKLKKQY